MRLDVNTNEQLRDCSTLEYLLLGDLRDLLTEALDRENQRWLLEVLDALLKTLPQGFQLKQEGGYLAEVIDEYPNWAGYIEKLYAEQRDLYAALWNLRVRIGRITKPELLIAMSDQLDAQLRDWIRSYVAHLRHERQIVQMAYTLDVGTGD